MDSASGATVQKSFRGEGNSERDRLLKYCLDHSTQLHPLQIKLMEETIRENSHSMMLGAPEVLNLNTGLMKALGRLKRLDRREVALE